MSVNVVIYGPHNLLLSALFYGGLPAAFLLICLFVALAAACFLYARRTGRLAPFALTVFLVTHGIFESGWLRSGIDWQWLYLWLPIGIGAGVELRARRSSN
jgi:O-antigen ligase